MTATFDKVRGEVLPGTHWVLRVPGVVAVVRRDDTTEVPSAVLRLIQDTVEEKGPSSGRELAVRLTRWVIDTAGVPGFGAVAATADGIAVLLHGDVNLCELTTDVAHTHDRVHLIGLSAALTIDRLLPWPSRPLALTVGTPATVNRPALNGGATGPLGLIHGLVPGIGVVLNPRTAPADFHETGEAATPASTGAPVVGELPAEPFSGPSEPEPTTDPDLRSPPSRQQAVPSAPPTAERSAAEHERPRLSARIHGWGAQDAERTPLPVTGGQPTPAPSSELPAEPAQVVVEGFRCSRGHLNDPRVAFCSSCGIRMYQRTGVPVQGRRPPLGLLLFDDGTIFVVDDDYLLGRQPVTDEAVLKGPFQPIRLDDDSGTVSRLHAEIRLENWNVVLTDRGSTNGTHVTGATDTEWMRLTPHQPFVLETGTKVRIGRRTFTFQSARATL